MLYNQSHSELFSLPSVREEKFDLTEQNGQYTFFLDLFGSKLYPGTLTEGEG
jgi:hypothetical protein